MAIEAGPLVDHEWLFELAAWPFWAHGLFPVFALLCTAATASTPLVARTIAARCGATPWSANAAGYLTIVATVTSYAVRPQSFAVLAFGFVLLLALGPLERPWRLGLLAALWANLHGSAVLAPAVVAIVAAGRLVQGAAPPLRARLWAGVAFAALGTLVTPLGLGLYAGAAQYTPAVLQTADWRPLSLDVPIEVVALGLYAYVLISGGVPVVRANAVALALLAAFGALWFAFVRFLPFFGLAAVPALTLALRADGRPQGRHPGQGRPLAGGHVAGRGGAGAWLGLPVVVAVVLAGAVFAPLSVRPDGVATAAEALVRASGFRGPLFVPFEAAAYLELERAPVRVLLDAHATPYAPAAWAAYRQIDAARPGWQRALAIRGIGGAIASDGSALAGALAADRTWSPCAHASGWTLYARNGARDRRTLGSTCRPWTGASSPTPTPISSPPSPQKSTGKSRTSS